MRAEDDVARGVARGSAGNVAELHLVRSSQQRTHLGGKGKRKRKMRWNEEEEEGGEEKTKKEEEGGG